MSTWIKDKRKESGLSQGDVAKALGVSRPTYVKLEKGVSSPTEQQQAVFARLFGVSSDGVRKRATESRGQLPQIQVREVPVENVEKFKEVLLYILGKVGSRPNMGQTALYKLLYFIDFDYYEKFEEQLVGAMYIKNTYGPTPVSFAKIVKEMENQGKIVTVKSKYFGHDQTKYVAASEADVSLLNGRELKHIDDEIERLAHLSARQLSELSHVDTPWKVAEEREVLDYEFVFYRPEETSVREYESL